MADVVHRVEEPAKLSKLQREKPQVWAKMQKFDEMLAAGKSIAIVRLEYSYQCNLRCKHCCISDFQKQTGRTMTVHDVRSISQQADEYGLARFVITGGEPLIFREFDAIVSAIDPHKHYINVDTNGWGLTPQRAKHLKKIGCDRIQLSIDSYFAEEHDKFRGATGSHARAVYGMDAAMNAGLDVFVQTTVTKSRLYSAEFVQFLEFFNRNGVGVFVTFIKPIGEWKDKGDLVTVDDIRWFENTLEKKYNTFSHLTPQYGRDMGCIAFKGMVSITSFGECHPCPYWFKSMGNVYKEPLAVILDRAMKSEPFTCRIDTCPAADCAWKDRL